jgi:hypothetical protein
MLWGYKSFWFGMTLGFTADSRKSRIQNSKIGFCTNLYKSPSKAVAVDNCLRWLRLQLRGNNRNYNASTVIS